MGPTFRWTSCKFRMVEGGQMLSGGAAMNKIKHDRVLGATIVCRKGYFFT